MANLKENNRHNLKLMLNYDEYWDFFLDLDGYAPYSFGDGMYDDCLISYIDACNPNCFNGDTWLYSTDNYSWESGTSIDNTLYDISYTGTDNGLFRFRKDRISNKDFLELYQNNSYRIKGDDYRLKLHAVSGNTLQYEYPLHVENCQIKLNGGFYQGFFKTECDKYQILPSKLEENSPWEFEFELKKCDLEAESTKTLNDKYPENKGIFFYIGTRAENKWVYLYKDDDECFTLSPDDYVEDAHIDKKDYIIGNFYDPYPDFQESIEDYMEDYTNYNYYNDKYYQKDCDDEIVGLEEYVDEPYNPKIIDENLPHDNFDSWCCNVEEQPKKDIPSRKFFRTCMCKSCGCISRTVNDNSQEDSESNNEKGADIKHLLFGNDYYISDFDGLDYDTDYWEPELDISDFEYETENEIKLKDANKTLLYSTDNKFILFNRTCTGYTINNWVDGLQLEVYGRKNKFKDNLFVLMNRTCTGYTVDNINELRDKVNNEYDYADFYGDLYNNAMAFRITDDGEVGYRLLTIDCSISGDDKTKIEEGYSNKGVIKDCQWQTIHVKIIPTLDTMKLYFYVDGKLVYITKNLPKLDLRELNEMYEKQEGVPYNISLGGGTQGLAETILPNYMLNPYRVYPLEKYFAGSFIGYMKSFKFYDCSLEYGNILQNYKFENKNN